MGRPQVDWNRHLVIRNILVHEYFGLDMKTVWDMVLFDMPAMKPHIEAMLSEMTGGQE